MANIQKIQEHYGVHLLTCEVPESMEVVSCFGLVQGQAILGANFVKDFFARVTDVTGGKVSGYEREMDIATSQSLETMTKRAAELGANAVVAVRLQAGAVGTRMLMASCSGTAFILRDRPAARATTSAHERTSQYLHPQPLG